MLYILDSKLSFSAYIGLSKSDFHKFKHNFRATINPMCPTNDSFEDTEHFLVLCPSLAVPRRDILAGVFALLRLFGYTNLKNNVLMQILLYGDENFPDEVCKNIQFQFQFICFKFHYLQFKNINDTYKKNQTTKM